jgi:hypothetical protein
VRVAAGWSMYLLALPPKCSLVNAGAWVNLFGPLQIYRSVDQNANGTWKYTITKPIGGAASFNPLP